MSGVQDIPGKTIGNSCESGDIEQEQKKVPELFKCYSTDVGNQPTYCDTFPPETFHGDQARVCKYSVPEGLILVGNSQYANSRDYDAVRYQSQHAAETKYAPNAPHARSSYIDLNREVVGPSYDPGTDAANESWVVSKPTGSTGNSKVGANFPGGWAGDCNRPDSEFSNIEGEWKCSPVETGEPETNTLSVDFFEPEGAFWEPLNADQLDRGDVGQNNKVVGFRVSEEALYDNWTAVHPYTTPFQDDSDTSKVSISAQCWKGTMEQRPTSNVGSKTASTKVKVHKQDPANPNDESGINSDDYEVVAVDIPDRTDSEVDENRYACVFGFSQKVYSDGTIPAGTNSDPAFGNPPLQVFNSNGDVFSDVSSISGSDPAYITEGTLSSGEIRGINRRVVPKTQDWIQSRDLDSDSTSNVFAEYHSSSVDRDNNRNPVSECKRFGDC